MPKQIHKLLTASVALALTAGLFGADPAVAALGDPHVIPPDPVAVDDVEALLRIYTPLPGTTAGRRVLAVDPTAGARCGNAAAEPVPDGQPIRVSLPPAPTFTVGAIAAASWRNPPVADATWRMQYQGLMWIKPLARRAAADSQAESLAALVAQAAAFHRQNPDPGTNNYGWDEGTALRRLETENCLYALTGSELLRPGMTADAKVLLGSRYYGPPYRPVHNHGLMANLQLIRAGDLLGVPAWKKTATGRLTSEATKAFSARGLSYEQSSMYHGVNTRLWASAVSVLRATPGSQDTAATIDKTVKKARNAYEWLTEPDGSIVQVGDSDNAGGPVPTLRTPRVLRDDQAGWGIGRWSWTDPRAVYYTVRYGPKRWAHGQHDRAGGVTFSAAGVRVLVGPGRYSYDLGDSYRAYQLSPNSHNVALPEGGKVTDAGGKVTANVVRAAAHNWTVQDKMFGTSHTRGVNVNRDTRTMRVTDTFPDRSRWRQYFHLAPGWTLVPGAATSTKMVFAHPSGRRLTITTTGRVSGAVQGITRPPQGWNFPQYGSRVRAYEIVIRSYARSSVTSFQVS
ncbi:heparinase II/III family protein [Actinoplanes sp. NPDC048791]|uniref:heparinase II/III family protein n=1 Tax=Actinoplanes sp. NPDC048791 TaxID=3154623 RepID=UPI0033C2B9B1